MRPAVEHEDLIHFFEVIGIHKAELLQSELLHLTTSDTKYVGRLLSRWNTGGLINGAASWTWAISVGGLVKLSHNNSLNALQ